MRKRIVTVVLVSAVAVGITACGGKADDSAQVAGLPVIEESEGLGGADTQRQSGIEGQTDSDGQQVDAGDGQVSDGQQVDAGEREVSDGQQVDAGNQQASDGQQPDAGERQASDGQQSDAGDQQAQGNGEVSEDDELEEKLAAFRRDRDDSVIDLGNGVTMGGSKNPENYGFSIDMSAVKNFDTRELTEGYAAGKNYVENTLGFVPETRNTVYSCADPRIWAIYDAEDKGVANGYAPENIFICEYCDHGTWQYLILVRAGKGSPWEVIHHGSSYRTEEGES